MNTRYCLTCKHNKPFFSDKPHLSKERGFHGTLCWDCHLAYTRAASKAWREANPVRMKMLKKDWYKKNPTKHAELNDLWYKNNPGRKTALCRTYQLNKLQRTPPWADLGKINEVYALAAKLKLTVDHVIPLQGKLVSGLHVHTNLQLLTKTENSIKNNKFEVLV